MHPLVPISCCFTAVSEGHLLPHVELVQLMCNAGRNQCHVAPLCRFDRTIRPRNRSSEDPVSLRGHKTSVCHDRFGYQQVFPFWHFVETIPIKGSFVSPVFKMDLGSFYLHLSMLQDLKWKHPCLRLKHFRQIGLRLCLSVRVATVSQIW